METILTLLTLVNVVIVTEISIEESEMLKDIMVAFVVKSIATYVTESI